VHAQGADLDDLARRFAGLGSARVLDLGCGAGHASYAIARHVQEVCAYDVSSEMLEVVKRAAVDRGLHNVRTQQGAAERLPFEAQSFDVVVSRLSAHHWRDVPAALREVARVVTPGGTAVFIDSAGADDVLCDGHLQAIELLRDRSHVRNYTLQQWQAMFAAAGFACEESDRWRMSIQFASWIARMRTPPACAVAIAHVWQHAPAEVREHYRVQPDGSFELDILRVVATRRG
jgi:ubiquinone/menaquinone biosynthesis C-methylase UbiE